MGMLPSQSTASKQLWFMRCWRGREGGSGAAGTQHRTPPSLRCGEALGKFLSFSEPQSPHPQSGNSLTPCRGRREGEVHSLWSALQTQEVTALPLGDSIPTPLRAEGYSVPGARLRCRMDVHAGPQLSFSPQARMWRLGRAQPWHQGHTKRPSGGAPLSALQDGPWDLSSHPGRVRRWQMDRHLFHN